jgi:hypothetical protein
MVILAVAAHLRCAVEAAGDEIRERRVAVDADAACGTSMAMLRLMSRPKART